MAEIKSETNSKVAQRRAIARSYYHPYTGGTEERYILLPDPRGWDHLLKVRAREGGGEESLRLGGGGGDGYSALGVGTLWFSLSPSNLQKCLPVMEPSNSAWKPTSTAVQAMQPSWGQAPTGTLKR